ncbi:hypothetical protein [Sorangium sp. So ce131]|uniref:hypothetical protein n=1 Tax=Sorangium sp. So ce131 TaxID=3133282 RepID=UPI003F5EF4B7
MLPPLLQSDVDALFERARSARVIEGGAARGKPMGGAVLATFGAEELPALREALRIVEDGPPFHCGCHGDLAIELRGLLLRVGVLSYHHGKSVRLEGAFSDAALVDGPALLRLLAARGVTEPLARHEAGERDLARMHTERDRWMEAAPEALRERLLSLEGGPLGLPPSEGNVVFDAGIAALRASGDDDRAIASRLFAWLGTSTSPWSGYPAYEHAPLVLLQRLSSEAVLAALLAARDDDTLLGAARYAADHQVVSFRKRFVREIPEETFVRFEERLARVPMTPDGLADAKARLAAARTVAASVRGRAAELAAQRGRALACVALSDDGPFGALVTDGQTLAAVDVYTVVRIDPERGSLAPLTTYEGSPFTDLVFVDGALLAVRGNEGRVDHIALDGGGRSVVASELARPLDPVDSGGVLCFVSAPFEDRIVNGVRSSVQRTSLVRLGKSAGVEVIAPVEAGVAALAADATHLYYATTNLEREGALFRVARAGGRPSMLTKVGRLGHATAQPALVIAGEHAVFADGRDLRRVPVGGGQAVTLHRTDAPIGALAVVSDGIVVILGDMSDGSWDVVHLPSKGGKPRKLGALQRRPYDRLRMVSRGGEAFFTLDDRLYRAR